MSRVAVVGAGIQGVCVSLELADRGCSVDLFDACDRPFQRASGAGEGKIHRGFLYALDRSARTATLMERGSRVFFDLVSRWAGRPIPASALSRGFVYAVHRESLIPPDEVAAHIRGVAEHLASGDDSYPRDTDVPWIRAMSASERSSMFSDDVVAAFETPEVAVDPTVLGRMLTDAAVAAPTIEFRSGTQVDAVAGDVGRYVVVSGSDRHGPYDHVVNAAWEGRLLLDASRGIQQDRPWLFRTKVGVEIDGSGVDLGMATSTTIVLGPFGDIVSRSDGRWYLSWYPVALVAAGGDLRPPEWSVPDADEGLIESMITGIAGIIRDVDRLRGCPASLASGTIFSWGTEDIDRLDTELHERFDIGPRSTGGYHSIDTGKLTMAPRFAVETADRIAPRR